MMGLSTSPASGRSSTALHERSTRSRASASARTHTVLGGRRALIAREEVMFVASRRVIQGAIRVKVHRVVRDVRPHAHATYSPFFLHPSRARTDRAVRAGAPDRTRAHKRKKEKERCKMLSEGEVTIKRGEGAADALVRFLSCCGALPMKPMQVYACRCVQRASARGHVRGTDALPPLCVRLRTFAISLNPQTTCTLNRLRFESAVV